MDGYELILEKNGEAAAVYAITAEGLIIGRAPDVDVVLPGQMVSRKHARVWFEQGKAMTEDLGSRNGIGVNGRRVLRAELNDGDELIIGDATFRVAATRKPASKSSIITYEKAGTLADEFVRQGSDFAPILYRAAQLLGTVFDLDDLLMRILEIIFEAVPQAQRGFIVTLREQMDEPEIHARLSRAPDTSADDVPLSHTLIRHVFEHRSAMLTTNAMDDSRFDSSHSIMQLSLIHI